MSEEEFLQKREELERELNALRPIDYDNLLEAADLLANFRKYWDNCINIEQPEVARQQLLAKIMARVFVFKGKVFALALHGDFSVIPDKNEQTPGEVSGVVRSYFGDDGHSPRVEFIACSGHTPTYSPVLAKVVQKLMGDRLTP